MKYEFEVEVGEQRDKREAFLGSLSMNMIGADMRVRTGAYRVTIERLRTAKDWDGSPTSGEVLEQRFAELREPLKDETGCDV